MKVLLLEDDPHASELLSFALGQIDQRYDFLYASRLSQALALLDTQAVDIALIDLGLPDATDAEAGLALRSQFPDVPIVALTGHRFDDLAVPSSACPLADSGTSMLALPAPTPPRAGSVGLLPTRPV